MFACFKENKAKLSEIYDFKKKNVDETDLKSFDNVVKLLNEKLMMLPEN